ncbi:mucin-1-like, partial [Terrapene carolina triunguis]|uniref:mucin-1-like n=1 Tax=Terrapene triunguis TaxID=2587831 RepID=UPI00115694A1
GDDSVLVTFKGCATPAMCQSSLLALVQELDGAEVYCCTGSLCNTRIMDGRVAEGRPSHPSPTHAPTPKPDCILEEDEEEEDVVPVAGGHPPLAGSHGDREAKTTESSEGRGLEEGGAFVAGNHAASPTGGQGVTPRPSHVATGGHGTASAEDRDNAGSRDNAFSAGGVFSESNPARPTGIPHPDPRATGGPTTIVLDGSSRSEPDTNKTPENTREIPAGSGLAHTNDEEEECEEETNYSARDHITGGSGTESRTGSARESFVAEGSATHSTDGSTPGSPGNQIDTVVHIPHLATRQNESFFSEDKEGSSSQPSASPASPTGTILAAGGAGAGSHRGKNKTLCTKRPGVAPVGQDIPARTHPGAPETVAKPEGSLERTEGDRDWPTISFPITVETPNSSLRGHLGNASALGLDPVEGLVKNSSDWLYANTPGKPRPPYPSGAFGLGSNFGLVTLTLLLAVLLH